MKRSGARWFHRRSHGFCDSVARLSRCVIASLLLLPGAQGVVQAQTTGAAHQPGTHAHVHGQANLDLSIEHRGFVAELTIPLEVLVGFERAPRHDDERTLLDRAIAVLVDPPRMLRPSVAAGCTASPPSLQAPDWSALPAGSQSHHDLVVRYRFDCQDRARLLGIEVVGFDAFSRLRVMEVRIVDERGARSQRLGRSARIAKLSR